METVSRLGFAVGNGELSGCVLREKRETRCVNRNTNTRYVKDSQRSRITFHASRLAFSFQAGLNAPSSIPALFTHATRYRATISPFSRTPRPGRSGTSTRPSDPTTISSSVVCQRKGDLLVEYSSNSAVQWLPRK